MTEKYAPRIKSSQEIGRGKWLVLKDLSYIDQAGDGRRWESVSRVGERGAVAMVATLRPSRSLILTRQYRPAVDGFVIEFPAGLIDDGETAEAAAVRELAEETGFHGRVDHVLPAAHSSPGLTGEWVAIAMMTVDGMAPANLSPCPRMEASEFIETFIVPKDGLMDFIIEREALGDRLESKILSFAIGVNCHEDFSSHH